MDLFLKLHSWADTRFIELFASAFHIIIPALLVVLVTWIFTKREYFWGQYVTLGLSVSLAWVSSAILKQVFKHPRPAEVLDVATSVTQGGFSFPSGHATAFMALAVAMWVVDRKLGRIFILIALLGGLSRVVAGVHFPIDVFFGWALGASVAAIVYYLAKGRLIEE